MVSGKINAAVLGLGYMGEIHLSSAKESPYIDKIYGYEEDPEKAEMRGRELGMKITSDLDSLLKNPDIHLFYIATPNNTHIALAGKALRAGKAVLCEKPMGETLEQAKMLLQAEKETENFLQIGFELHYSRVYVLAKEWIDKGLIGKPLNSHVQYYSSEFHKKNTWRSNSRGSLIGEKLSHYLDAQKWFIGSEVEEVFSMTSPNVVPYFNHPDNHQISLRYKNGSVSQLNFLMYISETDSGDPLLETLEKQQDDGHALKTYIMGTKGAIEIDIFKRRIRRWEFTENEVQLISKIAETVTYKKEEEIKWMHNVHDQNLRIAELVAKGMSPEVPAIDAFRTMEICFAAEISEQEKRIVKISEL